jgi:hypothetical protein
VSAFTVDWDDDALQLLAAVWMQAADKQDVSDAIDAAEALLARDPLANGRTLSEGLYRIDVPPVIINYTVDTGAHHVEIVWIRHI